MNELSTTAIAHALGTSRQTVLSRAGKERWLCKGEGKALRFLPRALPRDVLMALTAKGLIDTSLGANTPAAAAVPGELEAAFLSGTEKEREVAQYRAALVGLYLHRSQGINLQEFVEQYNAGQVSRPLLSKLGEISVSTLYRWVSAHRSGGRTPAALMPKHSLSKRKRGAGAGLSELAKHYLDFYWLRDSRPSMRSAWLEVTQALPEEAISYPTASRYLSSIPAVIRDHKRYGISRMETMDLPHIERNLELYHSMDQLVSDHHCFDFLVEKDGNLFRPWITAVQDFRSGKIVGFWPSVYPSSLSISLAFYLAVSRFGACKLIHIDNGKDYRSMVLNGATKKFRVLNEEGFPEEEMVELQGAYALFSEKVTFAKPYHGASKGRMERTFGTFAQLFSRRMAGYVGSNTRERPDDAALYWRALNKRARRHDIHSWEEYVQALASFVDWFNASWIGEGKGMEGRSPDQVFEACALPPRRVSPDILALAFCRGDRRRVGKQGIRFEGVHYWADELIAHVGTDVLVRSRIDDPDTLLVSDHRGALICSAKADYFLETGDLAADNERLAATKRKGFAMVRDAEKGMIAPPEGSRGLIDFASRAFPTREALPLAVGGAVGAATGPAPGPQAAHPSAPARPAAREVDYDFLDLIGKES